MIDIEKVRHALPAYANELIIRECIRLLGDESWHQRTYGTAAEEVAALCRAYYLVPGNEVGGALHIVLDDGNIDDHFVEWCGRAALKIEDVDDGRDVDPAGWLLSRVILRMSEDERQDLYEENGR